MTTIEGFAAALPNRDRDAFLQRVASLLHGVEIGDGSVALACRMAHAELYRPNTAVGVAKTRRAG